MDGDIVWYWSIAVRGSGDDGARSPSSRSVEVEYSKVTGSSAPGRDHKSGKRGKKDKENMQTVDRLTPRFSSYANAWSPLKSVGSAGQSAVS